MKLDI